MRGKQQNLIGMKFGRLFVQEKFKKQDKAGIFWICLCDCGNKTSPISTNSLLSLKTKSCGCYKIEKIKEANTTHNLTKSRTYVSWRSMWARCTDNKRRDYDFYKEKIPYDRWKSFENFFADMGERPPNTSLDRIDNSKGYFKENCRWATYKQQGRNKSSNIYLNINGEKYCLKAACELFNTSYTNAKGRIKRGWGLYEAVTIGKTNKHEMKKIHMNKEGIFVKDGSS
jgi:hypothetical protein